MSYGWMRPFVVLVVFVLLSLAPGSVYAESVKTLSQNVFTTAESLEAGLTQAGVRFSRGESYQSFYPPRDRPRPARRATFGRRRGTSRH